MVWKLKFSFFAPANVYNIISDHLHCLVTSASTSAQLIPPGQEPAIPVQSRFTKVFSLSIRLTWKAYFSSINKLLKNETTISASAKVLARECMEVFA